MGTGKRARNNPLILPAVFRQPRQPKTLAVLFVDFPQVELHRELSGSGGIWSPSSSGMKKRRVRESLIKEHESQIYSHN